MGEILRCFGQISCSVASYLEEELFYKISSNRVNFFRIKKTMKFITLIFSSISTFLFISLVCICKKIISGINEW